AGARRRAAGTGPGTARRHRAQPVGDRAARGVGRGVAGRRPGRGEGVDPQRPERLHRGTAPAPRHGQGAAPHRRAGADLAGGDAGRAGPDRRDTARGRAGGRAAGVGAAAADRCLGGGVPDRAGGHHQRDQARPREPGPDHRHDRRTDVADRGRRRRRGGGPAPVGTGAAGRSRDPWHGRTRLGPGRNGRCTIRVRRHHSHRFPAPGGTPMITVAVVDDQSMVRAGLISLLDRDPEISIVGEAGNGKDGVALVRRTRPEVVLMDIRMPVLDGIEATSMITSDPELNDTQVVILTTFDEDEHVLGAIRAGAAGFLLKDVEPDELRRSVRLVAGGSALLAPSITGRVLAEVARSRSPQARPELVAELTDREREVLAEVGRGRSNEEVGTVLHISPASGTGHSWSWSPTRAAWSPPGSAEWPTWSTPSGSASPSAPGCCWTRSASVWTAATWSVSWAVTVTARPPCCGSLPASWSRTPAGSPTPAARRSATCTRPTASRRRRRSAR